MSKVPSDVPQRQSPGTGVAGERYAADRDVPDEPQGPGAGEAVQPVLGAKGATAEAAQAAGTHNRQGYRIVPDDES